MAGLGKAYFHVAAVLFAAQTNALTKYQFSSTSLPCSWLTPTFQSVNLMKYVKLILMIAVENRVTHLRSPRLDIPKKISETTIHDY